MDTPELPDARVSTSKHAQLSGAHRRWAFEPVLFRDNGQWRFGVVDQWIWVEQGRPWVARIVFGPPTRSPYQHFYDYLHDGAIVPLQLDTSAPSPLLSLRWLSPPEGGEARPAPPRRPDQGK